MTEGRIDTLDAIAAPLFSMGSLAAAKVATITVDPGGAAVGLTSKFPIQELGVGVTYGSIISAAILALVAVYHGVDPRSDLNEAGKVAVGLAVGSMGIVAFVPTVNEAVTSSLGLGVGYVLLQIAAYYFIAYSQ